LDQVAGSLATELGYLGIGVSDLDAWKAFASGVLGLEVTQAEGTRRCALRMDYWAERIILIENGEDDISFAGWRVADEEAFEIAQERLLKAGIPYEIASQSQAAERGVLGLVTLHDPAGVKTEIFFGPHIEPALPFHPGRRMHGGFVTGEAGLGHFVIDTPKAKECEDFYRRILGMRGSLEFERQLPLEAGGKRISMRFMSCNARQHSIAFGDLGGGKRLSHMMTEVSRLEDVGLARDIVKRRAIPVFLDIGQHHNDRVVSFYFQTPSGWLWEYGWGVAAASGQAEWGEAPIWGHEHMGGA